MKMDWNNKWSDKINKALPLLDYSNNEDGLKHNLDQSENLPALVF